MTRENYQRNEEQSKQECDLNRKANQLLQEVVLEEMEHIHCDALIGSKFVVDANSHAGPLMSFLDRKLSHKQNSEARKYNVSKGLI